MKRPLRIRPWRREISWRARATDLAVGALGVLGLAPFQIWPAMMLSLAMLFVRLRQHEHAFQGASTGFWSGIGYYSCGMFWIASAFFERGPEFIPLIVPLVFGLFVLLSLFWAWAGWLVVRLSPRPALAVPLFASAWFVAEFTRGHLFGGFPWNLPGYAWEAGTALSQPASVVGVYGLTYLMFALSGLLGQAWTLRRTTSSTSGRLALGRPALARVGAVAAVIAAMFAFGSARLPDTPVELRADATLRLVHVPFRQRDMMDPASGTAITNRYFRQSLQRPLDGVTHIVWPEGAVRGLAVDDLQFLSVFPQAVDAPLPHFLFSSVRSESDGRESRYYNSAVAVSYPDGYPAVAAFSDKYRLVPFAEVVPFEGVLSRLGFQAIAASFTPAPDKSNRTFPGLPEASVQVCYEVLFPGLVEGSPRLILTQSNDAWFGRSTGPDQHAATARMRSLEEGIPMVRVAANGWSGTVDAWGRWVERVEPTQETAVDARLPATVLRTPFSKAVHLILLLISVVVCGFCALTKRFGPSALN